VTLATAESIAVTRRVDVRMSLLAGMKPLRHGARVRLHHGTEEVLARVALAAVRPVEGTEWVRTAAGERGTAVPSGASAYARLRLERPAVLTRGDRLIVRACSPPRTIGGATVLDPEALGKGLRRPGSLERFQDLDAEELRDSASPVDASVRCVHVWLRETGLRGLSDRDLVRRGGIDATEAARWLETAAGARAVRVRDRIFDADEVSRAKALLCTTLERFHDTHRLEDGMPREALKDLVVGEGSAELFDSIVKSLSDTRVIAGRDRIGLQSRVVRIDPETARAREVVEQALDESGLMPPDVPALVSRAGVAPEVLDQVVRALVRDRRLVRVGTLLFHANALARLRGEVAALKANTPEVDVGTFKSRYGLSRKFAIPLLEWLDRERVTKRVGEKRVIL
jgi:selenocysteine-specific elongation factor